MAQTPNVSTKIKIGLVHGCYYIIWANLFYLFSKIFTIFKLPDNSYLSDYPILNLFLVLVIIAPLIEEVIFRLLPITVVQGLTPSRFVLWAVVLLSSIIFGFLHGSWQNIFIQGVGGIIFSRAFLRGGLISSLSAHCVPNFAVFILYLVTSILKP